MLAPATPDTAGGTFRQVTFDVVAADSALSKSIYLLLTFPAWGNRTDGEIEEVQTDADKQFLRLSKMLLVGEKGAAPELQAISTQDNKCKAWVKSKGFISIFKKGILRMPLTLVKEVDAELWRYKETRHGRGGLVDQLMDAYPRLIEEAEPRLRGQFRPEDYMSPEKLRRKFSEMEWRWQAWGVPAILETIASGAYDSAMAQGARDAARELEMIQMALRKEFQGILDHMVDRLSGVNDKGQPKDFTGSLLRNFRGWLAIFEDRNLSEDRELAKLVAQASAMIQGVDTDSLKDSARVRATIRSNATQIKLTLDGMVGAKLARSIVPVDED